MKANQKSMFRSKLNEMLRSLENVRQKSEAAQFIVELDQQAVGRLSRMDALQQQAMAKATEGNRIRDIERIEAALARLSGDEFGYCLECGEDIESKRLEINPTVLTCISCARG